MRTALPEAAPAGLARLTVVDRLYYASPGIRPHSSVSSFSARLAGGQAYVRALVGTEGWQPLDYGWVKDPSLMVVTNDSKEGALEIGASCRAEWEVGPGQSMRGRPRALLYVRGAGVRFTLTLVPA